MLYKITEKPLEKENPELLVIPEFEKVQDKVLKWIFLVYDYEGPYRKLPIKQRRELAADKHLFSETKGRKFDKWVEEMLLGNVPEVNNAIAMFKELQYDDDRETLNAITLAIRDLRDMLGKPAKDFKDAKAKAELGKKIRELAEEKKMLEQIFELRGVDEDGDDDFERDASELDEYMEEVDD